MNRIKYFLTVSTLLVCVLLSAQSPNTPAELKELIAKAMDSYPKLKEGNEYIKLSEARKELAAAGYMPIISGDANYRYAKPTPNVTIPIPGHEQTIQFFPANNYDFHLGLVQPVYDFGRTQANINKAKSETSTSKDNLENSKMALAYQVAQLYYGIVFLNKSAEVQNEQIKLLEENLLVIQNKIKDGDGLKFDLLSTQVKKNNAENRLIDIQTQLHKQYELLNMLTGNANEDYISAKETGTIEQSASTTSADNNLDIKLFQDKLTSASWDIKIAKRGWMPSVTLNAQAGYKNGFIPDINKLLFNYGVGAGLSIPIFSAARPNYQTKIAKINLQANAYALEAQRLSLNKDLLQATGDITAYQNKLRNYEIQIEQAQEALRLANSQFKNGVTTNLDVLTSQTNLQDALLGKIQLEYNLLLSKLELNRLNSVKFW